MANVALFAEDLAHEEFLTAMLRRLSSELGLHLSVQPIIVRGGYGKVTTELKEYVAELSAGMRIVPNLIVVATDANCIGRASRLAAIESCLADYKHLAVFAIPEPHIERWLLLDSAAFKAVLGRGCRAPDHKCARNLYKNLLADAVRHAGVEPLLGGIEHAQDIVNAMDLERMLSGNNSLSAFLADLIRYLKNQQ